MIIPKTKLRETLQVREFVGIKLALADLSRPLHDKVEVFVLLTFLGQNVILLAVNSSLWPPNHTDALICTSYSYKPPFESLSPSRKKYAIFCDLFLAWGWMKSGHFSSRVTHNCDGNIFTRFYIFTWRTTKRKWEFSPTWTTQFFLIHHSPHLPII